MNRLQHKITELWNSEYLGAKYALGGMTKEEGYDCFSLVWTILCKLGADIKPYWKDYDITNYWVDYDLELLPKWFKTLGAVVDKEFRSPGDVFLCKLLNGQWLVSIYLGPDICAVANGETMTVGACPYLWLKDHIVETRRCPH